MPILLPPAIQLKCLSLINLGTIMSLFSIDSFMHVLEVKDRLSHNEAMIQDLQDLQSLSSAITNSNAVNDNLRDDINQLSSILEIFIIVAYSPTRPCGMWSSAAM